MWVQVALFVASLVISHLLMPKPQNAKAAAFNDVKFPVVEDGTPKMVIFGDVWITDWCVIGVGNYRTSPINKKQKGLFGSKTHTVGHRYLMSIHMGLCLFLDDIIHIKVGDQMAWQGTTGNTNQSVITINKPNLFGGDDKEGGINGSLTLMKGADDQAPLSALQAMHKSAVPAYRGVVTLFFDGMVCANSPYPKAWSFRVRRTTCEWYNEKATIWLTDGTGGQIKAMNPAHIIFEAQTNSEWGRGLELGQLDIQSFKACADTLFDEKFGMCIAWKRQDSLKQFIQQILDHIGGALLVDRTTGLWRMMLIREPASTDSLPSFDYETGILRIEEDNNSSNDLITNQLVVSYTDPINNETRTVRTENLASIQRDGIILQNKTYVGLPTSDLAGRVASRDMKVIQSHLKKFKIVLDRRAYALQPASAFVLKIPQRGIDSIIMRAVRVEHHELTNGEITVTAVQDVFGLPKTTHTQVQTSLHLPQRIEPTPIDNVRLWELPYAHLLENFSANELANHQDGFVLILAERPNGLQYAFEIWARTANEQTESYLGNGQFIHRTLVQEAIAQTADMTTLTLDGLDTSLMHIGQCVLLNEEVMQISRIDGSKGQILVKRGCLDTVPTAHLAGSVLWAYDDVASVLEKQIGQGQSVHIKLLSQTTQGVLDIGKAKAHTHRVIGRHARPLPPANVKINGLSYPSQIKELTQISWVGRNKITQGSAIFDQLASHQTIETGSSFGVIISKKTTQTGGYRQVAQKQDIKNTYINIAPDNPSNDTNRLAVKLDDAVMIKVEVFAIKDGLTSLQRHSIEVAVG